MLTHSYLRTFMKLRLFTPLISLTHSHTNEAVIKSVDSLQTLTDILQTQKNDRLLLIDFFATWCPPCRLSLSTLQKISSEFPDIDILSVDIDQVPTAVGQFDIQAVPKILFFRNREKVGVMTGFTLNNLRKKIQSLLQPETSDAK